MFTNGFEGLKYVHLKCPLSKQRGLSASQFRYVLLHGCGLLVRLREYCLWMRSYGCKCLDPLFDGLSLLLL